MRYEPMRAGRFFILALFGVFAVAAVALVASTAAGSEPVGFTMLWLIALGWNAYWWLTRIAVAITLVEGALHWEAPLSSGTIPFGELIEIRPMRLASNVEVFVRRDGRPVLVMATKGLRELLAEVSRSRPDLPVRLGWQGRVAEWMPGRSRFGGRD